MKSVFIVLLVFGLTEVLIAQETAGDYMGRIGSQYHSIQDETWAYLRATAHSKNARKIDKKRVALLNAMRTAEYNIKKVGNYKGDPSLKDAGYKYLNIAQIVIKEDFDRILDMEKIAEESYDGMEAYLRANKEASDKLSVAHTEVELAEKSFALEYGINLLEAEGDKRSKKIEQATSTMNYYNKIYLVFFKSYKQEAYVLDAFNSKDIGAFEQNRNTLTKFSEEGLTQATEVGSYKGDPMMKLACTKLLKYYKEASEQHYEKYSELLVIQNRLNKTSEYFNSIKQSKRTQADIDKYNDAVNAYNDYLKVFSPLNEMLNKRRAGLMEEWNKNSSNFFSKHVPK